MPGPNMILDKGYKVTSTAVATSVAFMRFVQIDTADATGASVTSVSGASVAVAGVAQETLDAAKILTGKAALNIRMAGLARVVSDGSGTAIAIGDAVTTDTVGRAVKVAVAVGLKQQAGIAMQPSSAAGTVIDVWLTPFATVNTAVS